MRDFSMRESLLEVFPSPHHGSSHFSKKVILHKIIVDCYLLIDSRFIYLILASEEQRRYLMIKIVCILTVHELLMRII